MPWGYFHYFAFTVSTKLFVITDATSVSYGIVKTLFQLFKSYLCNPCGIEIGIATVAEIICHQKSVLNLIY